MTEQNIRVLLVEDDDIDREAVERHIDELQLPYTLHAVASKAEALEWLRKSAYDVVLLDYMFEDGTGLELLPYVEGTPAIFVTGRGSEQVAVEAMRLGAYDYLIKDDDRNYLTVLPLTIRNVLARKNAEKTVRESELKLQTLLNATTEVAFLAESDGTFLAVNAALAKSLGREKAEIIGTSMLEYASAEVAESRRGLLQKALSSKKPLYWEDERAGRYFDNSLYPILDDDGNVKQIALFAKDITERRQAEEHIKRSLKEKELLLQEIHHRVKNNLQIISSLLDMSRLRTRDQEAIDVLTDARARIHIISLVHTQLYHSEQFDHIDMPSHIRELTRYLSGMYAGRKKIRPVVEVSGVCLALTQAIPCALVLNELITNAFKHAFAAGQEGTLTVTMRQSPEGSIVLRVNDDGIGIRDDIDLYHTNTMGLKLVRKLVQQQLKGEIRVERESGTAFIITFKNSAKNNELERTF